jgi:hypothetical protein
VHFIWRKKITDTFFFPRRSLADAPASSSARAAFVFVLTLSPFRKIVGAQR